MSKSYDLVLTSGGIGPTHDDVTYEALASAFNRKLEVSHSIVEVIREHLPPSDQNQLDHPAFKMAHVPTGKLNLVNSYW